MARLATVEEVLEALFQMTGRPLEVNPGRPYTVLFLGQPVAYFRVEARGSECQ